MKTINQFLIITFCLTTVIACDKVDEPIAPPIDIPGGNDSISFPKVDSTNLNREFRKTLVEEFTGHTCTTCPRSTAELQDSLDANKDRMIVVAYHAGQFSRLQPPTFVADYTTPYGDEIELYYEATTQGTPSALVNRTRFSQFDNLIAFSNGAGVFWNDPINVENENLDQVLALGIAADYIDSLGLFYIQVSAEGLADQSGNYRVLTLCIEDSIVSPQVDNRLDIQEYPKQIDKEYVHKHMVRAKLGTDQSIYGDQFISDGIQSGEWYDYQLNALLPDNILNVENTSIVVMVIDEDTEQIIQSEEVHTHVK